MKRFLRLSLFATLITWFLIFVGGLVRVSGAGLGCPDWPKCFGRWIPPMSVRDLPAEIDPSRFNFTLAWIEYINRLVGVLVGLAILAAAVLAVRECRRHRRIVIASLLALVLVIVQGWLGGRVVASFLEPYMVSLHTVLAFIIAALLLYAYQHGWLLEHGFKPLAAEDPRPPHSILRGLWVLLAGQVILGTLVRGGLEEAILQMPLEGEHAWMAQVASTGRTHTAIALLMLLGTGLMIFTLQKSFRDRTPLAELGWGLLVVVLVQCVLGLTLVFVTLSPIIQLFHLWLASIYMALLLILHIHSNQGRA